MMMMRTIMIMIITIDNQENRWSTDNYLLIWYNRQEKEGFSALTGLILYIYKTETQANKIGSLSMWTLKKKNLTPRTHHRALLQTAAELRGELSQTAVEHTKFLADHARFVPPIIQVIILSIRRGADILHSVKAAGFSSDPDRLQVLSNLMPSQL